MVIYYPINLILVLILLKFTMLLVAIQIDCLCLMYELNILIFNELMEKFNIYGISWGILISFHFQSMIHFK